MNNGWIKLHRNILDNPICKKADWAWLWIIILLLANHEDKEVIWNGEKKIIKRGSFITSRQKLALHSGIHESSVERALKYFKNEQQIEQQANKKFRLITVIKYNDYQTAEQEIEHQMNIKRTSNEHQLNTNKNDNKYKNDKNNKKIISNDIEQAPVEYGNKEINSMILALKQKAGIQAFVDSSIERNIAKHCVDLIGKIGKDEFVRRLDYLLSDPFHSKNCNKIRYIYHNIKGFIEPKVEGVSSKKIIF